MDGVRTRKGQTVLRRPSPEGMSSFRVCFEVPDLGSDQLVVQDLPEGVGAQLNARG